MQQRLGSLMVDFLLLCRVGGVLIPTRSFGDFLLKSEHEKPPWKQVISAVPQIQTFHLDSQWEFIVVASDGVWDAMGNNDMVAYIRQRLNTHSNHRYFPFIIKIRIGLGAGYFYKTLLISKNVGDFLIKLYVCNIFRLVYYISSSSNKWCIMTRNMILARHGMYQLYICIQCTCMLSVILVLCSSRDKLILSQLCEQILDMCCAKTVQRFGKNSCDNMTIIIVWFDHSDHKSETGSSVVSSCVSR